ncbi:hypothetical protein FQR65_LT20857 [Abscondita terminalis]|nr:hypothetical protein FQR65_LT20857 [Abscondita terminalis]
MSAADTPAVRLSDVRLDRGHRSILRGITLAVPRGSITAILGPSGSGKSTLLSALTGELPPAQGQVEVFGRPVPRRSQDLLEMRKSIGVLLQGNGLLTDLSVAENVALPLRAHTRLAAPLIQRIVEFKLNAVGLRAVAQMYPRELSGGMARRVALARALALDPPLMIYDEPLTGLDPIASGVIMSLIQRLNHTLGLTSIIVTHHVHETLPIADQAVVIANGSLVFAGAPVELENSTDPLGYRTLTTFGASDALSTLLGLSLYRELGPVLTALLFIGRAGSSIAAELGLMRATDQIKALELMAIDPIAKAVAPRFCAAVLTVPLLTGFFCSLAISASYFEAVHVLGLDNGVFWSALQGSVDFWDDFGVAMLKSAVFGGTSALVAAYVGYHAEPTIEGTSVATTRAVVNASLLFAVGAFLLLALASLLVLAMASTNKRFGVGGGSYELTARFTNLGQLRKQAPVKIGGVVVGQVADIRLDPVKFDSIVTLSIDNTFKELPSDTSAGIFTSGLLGENYVGLSPGGDPDVLKPGDEIAFTQPSVDLLQLAGKYMFSGGGTPGQEATPPDQPTQDATHQP